MLYPAELRGQYLISTSYEDRISPLAVHSPIFPTCGLFLYLRDSTVWPILAEPRRECNSPELLTTYPDTEGARLCPVYHGPHSRGCALNPASANVQTSMAPPSTKSASGARAPQSAR